MRIPPFFRSLSHRNFRLFFIGQTLSLSGSWMQQVAMSWLVYQMTNSSFLLGATLFLGQIPSLVISPLIGPLTDHWDRRRILYATQTLAMVQALILAALALTGVVHVWHIMALSFALGVTIAVDMPTRQTFLSEMVTDPKDLPNAIAMNATMFNAARLLGPGLAGFVLAATSPGICFLLNGISFLAVLWALAAMRLPAHQKKKRSSMRAGFREGLSYAWNFPPLRNILLLLCLSSVTGSATSVLLPQYTDLLHGDARLLGWLGSAMGFGAVIAALFLASRKTVLGHGLWIGIGIGLMGVALLAMPLASHAPFALGALFLAGFGLVVHVAAANTIIQTVADADKRGRIMGLYTMALIGVMPLGSLLTGYLEKHIGFSLTLAILGGLSLLGSAVFLLWLPQLHRHVRPIFVRLTLLPAVE